MTSDSKTVRERIHAALDVMHEGWEGRYLFNEEVVAERIEAALWAVLEAQGGEGPRRHGKCEHGDPLHCTCGNSVSFRAGLAALEADHDREQ